MTGTMALFMLSPSSRYVSSDVDLLVFQLAEQVVGKAPGSAGLVFDALLLDDAARGQAMIAYAWCLLMEKGAGCLASLFSPSFFGFFRMRATCMLSVVHALQSPCGWVSLPVWAISTSSTALQRHGLSIQRSLRRRERDVLMMANNGLSGIVGGSCGALMAMTLLQHATGIAVFAKVSISCSPERTSWDKSYI